MPKLNKKEIVLRMISPPKNIRGAYWSREYKILNELMELFPSEDFWQKVNFNQDWDSLLIFKSEYGMSLLKRKYKEFNFKIPNFEKIKLTKKSGRDKIISQKPKTIRDFLS